MTSMPTPTIPEHLPGEPRRERPAAPIFVFRLILLALAVALLGVLSVPLWPLYLLSVAIWGWPPNVPRLWQARRYLRLAWTVKPPPPGLPLGVRLWVTIELLRKCALVPFSGLAWQLDEALYGRQLRQVQVKEPLLEISAGRSGSTQLARYLEEDPHLVAPSLLQCTFPYLWLWRLAPRTIGRLVTPERVRHKIESMMPPEFLQRHESDPFRTDTFDAVLYQAHLNYLSVFLGPEVMAEDFDFTGRAPHNQELWGRDYVALLDGIARKTLVFAGTASDGRPRRFFLKGHFLGMADALERHYPDARFLTMIREPAPRLQSAVNFLRVTPMNLLQGPVPWSWLGQALERTEIAYCLMEQDWYTRQGGARRVVIRFNDYVRDLEAAMRQVYRECLDTAELPPHVPRVHPPRERTNYLVNRSLAQVGVDEAALNARLADYIAWCRGEPGDR